MFSQLRVSLFAGFLLWGLGVGGAHAAPPQRDLTVELRQVADGPEQAVSYRAGSGGTEALLPLQKIQVRNGQKGMLRFNLSTPVQWVEAVQAASANSGAGVKHALQWFDTGSSISATPRWPGGKQPATVELEVQMADMAPQPQADMPAQRRSSFSSTVTAPLGQWVTIAASGDPEPQPGNYSSNSAAGTARRLLQIRVLAP
ncbi:hypothetical protein [Rhodoferax sp.]|uniref:hypothetical protein n=1 Tax=Rhodoferax sp. TaxID=50421 RepID=UPI002ACDF004|nr:hypothetical protein [Rhodoferax sp.]MDZ7919339.1 hypothetical protein [Rhodoferax sp.]